MFLGAASAAHYAWRSRGSFAHPRIPAFEPAHQAHEAPLPHEAPGAAPAAAAAVPGSGRRQQPDQTEVDIQAILALCLD